MWVGMRQKVLRSCGFRVRARELTFRTLFPSAARPLLAPFSLICATSSQTLSRARTCR